MAKRGRVTLVGAGPGDPGLITVRGLEAIKDGDVIIYDYLANPALLKHAKESAERYTSARRAARTRCGRTA